MDDVMDPELIDAASSLWGYVLVGMLTFLSAIAPAYFKGKGGVKSAVNESIGMVLKESRKQTADMRAQLELERAEHKRELEAITTSYQTKIDEMKEEISELRRRQNEISEPL